MNGCDLLPLQRRNATFDIRKRRGNFGIRSEFDTTRHGPACYFESADTFCPYFGKPITLLGECREIIRHHAPAFVYQPRQSTKPAPKSRRTLT